MARREFLADQRFSRPPSKQSRLSEDTPHNPGRRILLIIGGLAAGGLVYAVATGLLVERFSQEAIPVDPQKVENFINDSGEKIIKRVTQLNDPELITQDPNPPRMQHFTLTGSGNNFKIEIIADKIPGDKNIKAMKFNYTGTIDSKPYTEEVYFEKSSRDGYNWIVTLRDSDHAGARTLVTDRNSNLLNLKDTAILSDEIFEQMKSRLQNQVDVLIKAK